MYPTNIKIEKTQKMKVIREKIRCIGNSIKKHIEYLLRDRKYLGKVIMVKLHI